MFEASIMMLLLHFIHFSSREEREVQERIRVLQNQNRFLNEEVRRLAKVRHQEHAKYKNQGLYVHLDL